MHKLDDAKPADGLARHTREKARRSKFPQLAELGALVRMTRDEDEQPRLVPLCAARTVIMTDLHSQADVASP